MPVFTPRSVPAISSGGATPASLYRPSTTLPLHLAEWQLPPEWRGMVHLAQNEEGNLVVETETKLPNTEETRLFHLVNHCYATYHRLLNAF